MRLFPLVITLVFFHASQCLSQTNDIPSSHKAWNQQSDGEIRRKITGTWDYGGYTFTNELGPFSVKEMLTYATNSYYSATRTIMSDGTTRIEKCEGFWSIRDRILTYSITNCMGVSITNCFGEPFFYPMAKVIEINGKHLVLLERLDQIVFFERDCKADEPLPEPTVTAPKF
jgi:hypothetical protein